MRSSRAAAVLFDMDGLLIDSEPLWTIAEIELATSLGGTWTNDLKAQIIGTRLDAAVPAILRWYGAPAGPEAAADSMAFLLGRMVELFRDALPLMPGALPLVDAVRQRGLPTALVSSSYRVLVDAALTSIGSQRFDITLAGDEVTEAKPSPEPYLRACQLLGVSPAQVVILEDAPSGVEAGEAAGATVIAVPSVAAIASAPGRVVVSSLTEIDPDWLVHDLLGSVVVSDG
jgi:HAD superfamily hydrolase (TIGR01509 family)